MGLLEKLRPQPKWKHTDPAVRLEGLNELEDTDRGVARRWRPTTLTRASAAAAIARVTDAAVLAPSSH